MNHSLEYWKKRCELAEKFIYESPVDPDVTLNQMKAFHQWRDFKNISNAAIEPEEYFLSFVVNEILALEAYLRAMNNAMSKVGILTPGRVEDFENLFMHVNNLKKLAGISEENNFKSRFNYDPTQESPIKGFHPDYEKTLHPRPKMVLKIPMSQVTVAIDGTIWQWKVIDGKIKWFYIGCSFSHTESITS